MPIKIRLSRDWFAPGVSVKVGKGDTNMSRGGQLLRGPKGPENGYHTIPDELEPFLPKSAIRVEGDAPPPKVVQEPTSFKALDPLRDAMEAVADKVVAAEQETDEQAEAARKFQEELERERQQEKKAGTSKRSR